MDWKTFSSWPEKQRLITEAWGDRIPDYLWYDIGNVKILTVEEDEAITTAFFTPRKPSFGDVEMHHSQHIDGTCLRIRHARHLLPLIELRGHVCHLYGVGHGTDRRAIRFVPARSIEEPANT